MGAGLEVGGGGRRQRWVNRPWVLPVTWALVVAVSVVFYVVERSLEHFLWHLGYGVSAGLVAAAGWALWRRRAVDHPQLWALAGYGWMVVPDLIWLAGKWGRGVPYPHQPWMDVFLGHYSLDRWGDVATALVVPVYVGAVVGLAWVQGRLKG